MILHIRRLLLIIRLRRIHSLRIHTIIIRVCVFWTSEHIGREFFIGVGVRGWARWGLLIKKTFFKISSI